MSITIFFPSRLLNNRTNEEVINILTNKIKDKGFDIDYFYKPYSPKEGSSVVFKFDLQNLQDEDFLANKLNEEVIFDETKILNPRVRYESIIKLEEDLSHELLEEKIKKITDFIALDDRAGKLTFSTTRITSHQLYLEVYSYSRYKEIYDKINTKKQELKIVSIELNSRGKIGESSKTSLNSDEINTFFQQENYDGVIKDLRQFMSSICEFLSTLPNTSINSSDANPMELLESIEKANTEEPESSSSSGSSVANPTSSKPKLMARPQLIDSSNSNSTEVPEPIEKANGEKPESSSSLDEISTESKSIE
ncbi:MAG: hypothetical protein VKL41_14120 [Snowella sp.]|nr:hypothetical protein [Snowella sp.]